MSHAAKLGTLYIFRLLVNRSAFVAFVEAILLISPGMMMLVAWVFEGRLIPLISPHQFWGFFPGDFFLAAAFAIGVSLSGSMPSVHNRWYQARWWHWLVLIGAFVGAAAYHYLVEAAHYTRKQLRSPSKRCHDFYIVPVYVYLLGTVCLPVVIYAPGHLVPKALIGVCVLVWVGLNIFDEKSGKFKDTTKAHPANYRPIWAHS